MIQVIVRCAIRFNSTESLHFVHIVYVCVTYDSINSNKHLSLHWNHGDVGTKLLNIV
jgi:hypothetical protein